MDDFPNSPIPLQMAGVRVAGVRVADVRVYHRPQILVEFRELASLPGLHYRETLHQLVARK